MILWIEKFLILLILLVTAAISALAPLKVALHTDARDGQNWRGRILDWLHCFSGGVFLSTMLLHLFPEVSEGFQDVMDYYSTDYTYPFAELTISCGFFLVLFLETLIMKVSHRMEDKIENLEPKAMYGQNGDLNSNVHSTATIKMQEYTQLPDHSEPHRMDICTEQCTVRAEEPKTNELYPLLQSGR